MGESADVATPEVTFSAVHLIFKYLRQHSPDEPSRLRELHVYSGPPARIGHGYPSPMAFWPEHNSMHFRCMLSERDDEAAQEIHRIGCPGLGKQANEYLRAGCKTFKLSEGYAHRYVTERVELARDGPKARHEGKAHYCGNGRDGMGDDRYTELGHDVHKRHDIEGT